MVVHFLVGEGHSKFSVVQVRSHRRRARLKAAFCGDIDFSLYFTSHSDFDGLLPSYQSPLGEIRKNLGD
jgi:hypothetical protein